MYHASLTEGTKTEVRRLFSGQSSLKCLVSTVAFGMVSEWPCALDIRSTADYIGYECAGCGSRYRVWCAKKYEPTLSG